MEGAIASALAGERGRFAVTVPHRMIVEVRPGPSYRYRRSALVLIDRLKGFNWTTDMLIAAYGLTPREADVVRRLCGGRSTDGIAADLGLAVGSVRLYLKRAMPKVGVNSQAQLVAWIVGG
jgi:DNA-binding CsgD family transcriptional regulator